MGGVHPGHRAFVSWPPGPIIDSVAISECAGRAVNGVNSNEWERKQERVEPEETEVGGATAEHDRDCDR